MYLSGIQSDALSSIFNKTDRVELKQCIRYIEYMPNHLPLWIRAAEVAAEIGDVDAATFFSYKIETARDRNDEPWKVRFEYTKNEESFERQEREISEYQVIFRVIRAFQASTNDPILKNRLEYITLDPMHSPLWRQAAIEADKANHFTISEFCFKKAEDVEHQRSAECYLEEFFKKLNNPHSHNVAVAYDEGGIVGNSEAERCVPDELTTDQLLLLLMERANIDEGCYDDFLTASQELIDTFAKKTLLPHVVKRHKKKSSKLSGNKRPLVDLTLIPLPPGLTWPSRSFSDAAKAGLSILDHLEAEWKPLISAGIATRRIVESFDETTLWGIDNYTRRLPGKEPRQIPPDLRPLTKSQVIDRAVEADPTIILRDQRVANTLAARLARSPKQEKLKRLLTATNG